MQAKITVYILKSLSHFHLFFQDLEALCENLIVAFCEVAEEDKDERRITHGVKFWEYKRLY
jgi:hypothetical protein